MDKVITASEANQRFSEMLRDVANGDSFTVLSRGRPVARVAPIDEDEHKRAFDRMMEYFESQPHIQVKPWKREDLYE